MGSRGWRVGRAVCVQIWVHGLMSALIHWNHDRMEILTPRYPEVIHPFCTSAFPSSPSQPPLFSTKAGPACDVACRRWVVRKITEEEDHQQPGSAWALYLCPLNHRSLGLVKARKELTGQCESGCHFLSINEESLMIQISFDPQTQTFSQTKGRFLGDFIWYIRLFYMQMAISLLASSYFLPPCSLSKVSHVIINHFNVLQGLTYVFMDGVRGGGWKVHYIEHCLCKYCIEYIGLFRIHKNVCAYVCKVDLFYDQGRPWDIRFLCEISTLSCLALKAI